MDISGWVISILSLAVLSVIADLFLNGRTGKFIKAIFASLTILVIIAPLPSIVRGIKTDFGDIAIDNAFVEIALSERTDALCDGLVKYLESNGVSGAEISVTLKEGSVFDIKNVIVNLQKAVIDKKYEHIDKCELVSELICSGLKISKGDVILYE